MILKYISSNWNIFTDKESEIQKYSLNVWIYLDVARFMGHLYAFLFVNII